MRRAVVEITSFHRLGSLKEYQIRAVFHEEPGSQRIMSHRFLIEPAGVDVDIDFRAGHAKNFRVKLLCSLHVIDRQTEMVKTFEFEHKFIPPVIDLVSNRSPRSFLNAFRQQTRTGLIQFSDSLGMAILGIQPSKDGFDDGSSVYTA